ncbi:hypothetical protein BC830DRAFT_1107892 [Chytriomyces sp. MP71]|nr:hypothetical protein BC830DRAFT_1107892 [Chytriomyces sp. MP71]
MSSKRSATNSVDAEANKRSRQESEAIKGRKLVEWAAVNGAQVDKIAIEKVDGLRGCVAASVIGAGETVAHLPQKLVLSEGVATASEVGTALREYCKNHTFNASDTDVYAANTLRFAAFLACERYHSNNLSFWMPYLDTLPSHFNLPIEWPSDQVERYLANTNILFAVTERRRMIHAATDFFNKAFSEKVTHLHVKLAFEELLWAYCAIQSRAFPKNMSVVVDGNHRSQDQDGSGQDIKEKDAALSELCLYPVLDMINHKRNQKIEWNAINPPGITFITPIEIRKGEIVWNNYGSKGNENLLSNYGFVLSDNPEDYAKISLNINPRDPLYSHRRAILSSHNIPTVHLFFRNDDELSTRLVEATRVLVANARELAAFELGGVNAQVAAGRVHLLALSTLYALVEDKLGKLTAGMQAVLDAAPGEDEVERERRAMARVYRRGQVDIFGHARELVVDAVKEALRLGQYSDEEGGDGEISIRFLTMQNPSQSGLVLEAVSAIEDVDEIMDQDTLLSLVLMHEVSLGQESAFRNFMSQIQRTDEDVRDLMGDLVQDIASFYDDQIVPFLAQSSFFSSMPDVFNASRFLWASSVLETNGLSISVGLLNAAGAAFLVGDVGGDGEADSNESATNTVFGLYLQ